jgi:hypothetical protein
MFVTWVIAYVFLQLGQLLKVTLKSEGIIDSWLLNQ